MRKIKVLMLVPNLFVANGVASFVMNYLRNLDHNEIQVDIASYKEGNSIYYSEVEKAGGKVLFLPGVKNLPEHIKACSKILSEGQYDIIHDNTLHISIPMMWCAKQQGISVRILHSHSSKLGETYKKELRNKLFRPVLRSLATDYLACSQMAGQTMFEDRKFTVLPNIIQTEKYQFDSAVRENVRRRMDAQGKYVIGSVGRLAAEKNPFFAIDVFRKLLEEMPNAEYWWVGSGTLDEQVKAYVEKRELSGKVKLLGSRNDIVDLYQGMDVFFLPSLFEGLSIVTVEAQAMGLPCVVSDAIPPEAEYTGLLKRCSLNDSTEEWKKLIKNLQSEKTDRKQYQEYLIKSDFSDVGSGHRLKKVYECFLSKKR